MHIKKNIIPKSLKGKFLLGFFCLLLLGVVFHKPLLRVYASWFYVENATKGADAILMLSGGDETRFTHTMKLMEAGFSNRVLFTHSRTPKRKYSRFFKHREEVVLDICAFEGMDCCVVPSLKEGATSTFDEAYDLAAYCLENNLKHIIIVTEQFHTRRAYYGFKKVFDLQAVPVKLEISGAPNQHFTNNNWWKTESGLTNYFLEPLKLLMYHLNSKNIEDVKEN
ncbi:MAG: uncharacterized SAM-binding protein YcdF (DUF218 family) [Flavobacteriales bacterium]|jgi:uncharacterized SAM-binding protein YcdF (DUF218 family)